MHKSAEVHMADCSKPTVTQQWVPDGRAWTDPRAESFRWQC